MNIKSLFAMAAISIALASCSKDKDYTPAPISGLNVIHASPTAEKLDFFVENTRANNTDFAFGNKMGYLNLYSGLRRLVTTKKNSSTPLLTENFTLEDQKIYSLFIYDKLDVIKYLMIKDEITAPASGKAKIRFVHLSPDAPALNLNIGGKDTDLFTDKSFKGYTEFVDIDPADKVTFNVKNKADGTLAVKIEDVKIEANKVYTVWVKGLKASTDDTKLAVAVFAH